MHVLKLVALAVLPFSARAATPVENAPAADRQPQLAEPAVRDPMNVYPLGEGCLSIPQQVAGEDREYRGTRLDRLPPGKLLLAVERQIDGCPQAVLASEENRRVREGAGAGR